MYRMNLFLHYPLNGYGLFVAFCYHYRAIMNIYACLLVNKYKSFLGYIPQKCNPGVICMHILDVIG